MTVDFAKLINNGPDFAALAQPATPPDDNGYPFGNPVSGARVLAYLAQDMPAASAPSMGGILASFNTDGQPKSRRQAFLKALEDGSALDGAAGVVGLEVAELDAALAVDMGLARAVRIAQAVGKKTTVDAGSAAQRFRLATTGGIDKPDKIGDPGTEYNDMKAKLASLIEATGEGLTGGEYLHGVRIDDAPAGSIDGLLRPANVT
ncbi:hypothetical protein [Bradyrhizobium liaoningense]|uniref:hypothetical protein n=1 Tax=Bradyrhizobium liaoningense TaxID=43992 RepID=UPI001BAA81D5|nr:hypothetical protein [Bradyrhizobium liaoningense]MBR0712699.1 hypothetical protein [Bradyrhizobium liaoningense]